MLDHAASYDALYRNFRWTIPARFNIAEACCETWRRHEADRIALLHILADGNVQDWTYSQLSIASNKLANYFHSTGCAPGDRIGILLPQAPETLKLLALRPQLPDLRSIIVTDIPLAASLPDHVQHFAKIQQNASASFQMWQTGPDDPAMMIYTSGTTGAPKGALHGHRVVLGHLPGMQMSHNFLRPAQRAAAIPAARCRRGLQRSAKI